MRRFILRLLGALISIGILLATGIGLFSTSAPAAAQPIFVTNTPPPVDVLGSAPETTIDGYALRLWTETELIDMLVSQINRLRQGEITQQAAIRLTLYELRQRYPSAPRTPEDRQRLLGTMLGAPRGTVNPSLVARPYLVDALNTAIAVSGPVTGEIMLDQFRVELTPLNFNRDGIEDALLSVTYPASAQVARDVLYADYVPVLGAEGGYQLLTFAPDIPVMPFDDVIAIELLRVGDVNQDSLDEFALGVDYGEVNNELLIYGLRNTQFANMAVPPQRIGYGEIRFWPEDITTIEVNGYTSLSERWQCFGAFPVAWEWSLNFYRPTAPLNSGVSPLPTVGCAMFANEPLYVQSVEDAIQTVDRILQNPTLDQVGTDRAKLALAMLYLIDGRQGEAETIAAELAISVEGNTWLQSQLDAFTLAAANNRAPIEVCAALQLDALLTFEDASLAACEVDQLIRQTLTQTPVPRQGNLSDNLQAIGLPVQEIVTVSQVGFADRQVVNFGLAGASWWSFAPTNPDFFIPSPTDPPVNFGEASLPVGLVEVPAAAYDALLQDNDLIGALTALDNAAGRAPGVPFSPEARYFEALMRDLLGERQLARQLYYDLWTDFSSNTWGQLAGAHLERRSIG